MVKAEKMLWTVLWTASAMENHKVQKKGTWRQLHSTANPSSSTIRSLPVATSTYL